MSSIACETVRFDTQALEKPGDREAWSTSKGRWRDSRSGNTCSRSGDGHAPAAAQRTRAAAGRPRPSQGPGRLRPGLEADPCVPVLQPGQGRAARRGLPGRPPGAFPEGPGAGESAAGRGGRRQRHPPRPVRGIEADGAARRRPLRAGGRSSTARGRGSRSRMPSTPPASARRRR